MLLDNGEVVTEPYIPQEIIEGQEADGRAGKWGLKLYTGDDLVNEEKESIFEGSIALVDYYVEQTSGVSQIEITPDKFGGNYYVEASTLFRGTNGQDVPAEFIIPNCKIQSNFTFSMSSSGDPSTFTFTLDAFPDYTRFNRRKKVLAALQIVATTSTEDEVLREKTKSAHTTNFKGIIVDTDESDSTRLTKEFGNSDL